MKWCCYELRLVVKWDGRLKWLELPCISSLKTLVEFKRRVITRRLLHAVAVQGGRKCRPPSRLRHPACILWGIALHCRRLWDIWGTVVAKRGKLCNKILKVLCRFLIHRMVTDEVSAPGT